MRGVLGHRERRTYLTQTGLLCYGDEMMALWHDPAHLNGLNDTAMLEQIRRYGYWTEVKAAPNESYIYRVVIYLEMTFWIGDGDTLHDALFEAAYKVNLGELKQCLPINKAASDG